MCLRDSSPMRCSVLSLQYAVSTVDTVPWDCSRRLHGKGSFLLIFRRCSFTRLLVTCGCARVCSLSNTANSPPAEAGCIGLDATPVNCDSQQRARCLPDPETLCNYLASACVLHTFPPLGFKFDIEELSCSVSMPRNIKEYYINTQQRAGAL